MLESLKAVAMEFPRRTSAILTKHTSLRSFHEKNYKGTPRSRKCRDVTLPLFLTPTWVIKLSGAILRLVLVFLRQILSLAKPHLAIWELGKANRSSSLRQIRVVWQTWRKNPQNVNDLNVLSTLTFQRKMSRPSNGSTKAERNGEGKGSIWEASIAWCQGKSG